MSLESITQEVKAEISKLTQVLRLLEGTGVKHTRAQSQVKAPRRNLSTPARRRISLAQKARWAKAGGHGPKPKRTMSAESRKRIAAAQRARWARVKSSRSKDA